jgi:putative hydrolase of the HAD superfamily
MPRARFLPPIIFFDAVGTLLSPEPSAPAVYAATGRRFGSRLDEVTITARFRTAFRRQEEADYLAGLRTSEERELARWRTIVGEVLDDVADREGCFQELYAHFARPDVWACVPEAAEVLETLSARGHTIGIASNFDHRLRGLVAHLPALRSVCHLVISSEIEWRKPAPDFFAEMCRQAAARPEQVLYVGDDPANDYDGARASGLPVLLFDPQQRTNAPPNVCITSLNDLL